MPTTLETRPITDLLRNPERIVARVRKSKQPELLTEDDAEGLVVLTATKYEDLIRRLEHMEAVAKASVRMEQIRQTSAPPEPISEAEQRRREDAMNELVAESQRLGLYK